MYSKHINRIFQLHEFRRRTWEIGIWWQVKMPILPISLTSLLGFMTITKFPLQQTSERLLARWKMLDGLFSKRTHNIISVNPNQTIYPLWQSREKVSVNVMYSLYKCSHQNFLNFLIMLLLIRNGLVAHDHIRYQVKTWWRSYSLRISIRSLLILSPFRAEIPITGTLSCDVIRSSLSCAPGRSVLLATTAWGLKCKLMILTLCGNTTLTKRSQK